VAQDALELTPEGKVLLRLRRPWRDGTRAIRFEPSELLEKLAAMVPRPRANLLIYHGAFAPRGCCREAGSCSAHHDEEATTEVAATPIDLLPAPESTAGGSAVDPGGEGWASPRWPPEGVAYVRPRYFRWADLLRRVFEFDVLACTDCGGRLRLVATIENPSVAARILEHLGLPVDLPTAAPARSTEWLPVWSD